MFTSFPILSSPYVVSFHHGITLPLPSPLFSPPHPLSNPTQARGLEQPRPFIHTLLVAPFPSETSSPLSPRFDLKPPPIPPIVPNEQRRPTKGIRGGDEARGPFGATLI